MDMTAFPADFLWGVSTSAFQIEGAIAEDGRGESIWDRFCARPGAIADGSDAARACEHYHRWRQDVELLRWLGVRAYRFSIAWPRVLPAGRGVVNGAGLDFYERLVDRLLEVGIEPVATLYHWDLPQALEDPGGWPARATAEAFRDYTDIVSRRLGDRVRRYVTHNEPYCASVLGYETGVHAPGIRDRGASLAAAHHMLLSHGYAVDVLRANVPRCEVGITLNLAPTLPASVSDADAEACRAFDGRLNRWFLDPLYGRPYPVDVIADHLREGTLADWPPPFVRDGDLATIATPTDFLGVNYYSRAVVRSELLPEANNAPRTVRISEEQTDMGWEVYPEGLYRLLLHLAAEYAPRRILITENGAAYDTAPDADGRVADRARLRYLYEHMAATQRAIAAGAPVAGYFVWSLYDNFEWAYGYGKRFGLVYLDYPTQARIPKDSARYCRSVFGKNQLAQVAP
jgi:beta-glucosidase